MDAIAHLCVPEIQNQSAPLVLVDGIRGDAEVSMFRRIFPGFTLIGIDSSFETRLARIQHGRVPMISRLQTISAERDERGNWMGPWQCTA